jgi:hypothetical protein
MEERMKENKKTESSSETVYVPVDVMDNESYIKLRDPSVQGFSNGSKSINDINVTYSHDVVEVYGQTLPGRTMGKAGGYFRFLIYKYKRGGYELRKNGTLQKSMQGSN